MNLVEEYCKRHSLRCPITKRPDGRTHLVYRADPHIWHTNWVIFQACIKQEQHAPSYFQFGLLAPIYKNAFRGSIVDYVSSPDRVEWENYDIEIIRRAISNDSLEPIGDLREAKLAVWEMFLYAADERVPQLPPHIRKKICMSLDPKLTINEKLESQEFVVDFFSDEQIVFAPRWDQCRSFYDPKEYAEWLAELILQMRDKSYRQDFSQLPDVA